VVLYRRIAPDKPVKKSDRDPVIAGEKVSLRTYKDVVVLYRRIAPDKPVKKSDRDPAIACDKVSLRTCQVTRSDRDTGERVSGHMSTEMVYCLPLRLLSPSKFCDNSGHMFLGSACLSACCCVRRWNIHMKRFPEMARNEMEMCCVQDVARRNIHVKRFSDIPMADVEMVFPEKKIWLKPIMFIQLAATLIAGLIAGIVSFRSVSSSPLSLPV
jgi:hypothetical protein